MALETTLVYDESLVKRAVYLFWRRSLTISFVVATAFLGACLVWSIYDGSSPWMTGASAAVLIIAIAMPTTVFVAHYRMTMRKFRALGEPRAAFVADDSTFTVSSAVGTSTLKWTVVQELWRFPEVWLLLFSKAQFVTLPTACLSDEMRAFILEHIEAAGGRIP